MVIWHVWDGDGAIDNTLGAQPMFTAGFNPTVAESLASGALLVALELYGHDAGLPWGEEQCTAVYLWSVLDGDMPPDPRDNFSGNEAFVTAPGYGNLGDVL
ncbi:MAG: hypothetical protein FJ125_17380, partial [Deltaproteobacteria bacterium]|nr:hypothetical protein [Deltaproteobacteria bacterium]